MRLCGSSSDLNYVPDSKRRGKARAAKTVQSGQKQGKAASKQCSEADSAKVQKRQCRGKVSARKEEAAVHVRRQDERQAKKELS